MAVFIDIALLMYTVKWELCIFDAIWQHMFYELSGFCDQHVLEILFLHMLLPNQKSETMLETLVVNNSS